MPCVLDGGPPPAAHVGLSNFAQLVTGATWRRPRVPAIRELRGSYVSAASSENAERRSIFCDVKDARRRATAVPAMMWALNRFVSIESCRGRPLPSRRRESSDDGMRLGFSSSGRTFV